MGSPWRKSGDRAVVVRGARADFSIAPLGRIFVLAEGIVRLGVRARIEFAFLKGREKDEAQAARWVFSAIEKGDDLAVREMNTNASAWGADFRKELQRRLQTAGLYAGPSDGRFGPTVADAVTALAARTKQH
jgi:hypothetical protein